MRIGRLQRILGQGRAFIGRVRFLADQRDGAFVAQLAQRRRRHRAGLAGADDEDRIRVGHGQPCRSA